MSTLRVAFEPPPYSMSGSYSDGPSFVKDLAAVKGKVTDPGFDKDAARGRLRMFSQWTQDLAAKFATVDTTTAADVIPPGYRALASILLDTDRPFWQAARHAQIESGAPFTAPDFSGVGTTGDHTEGDPPTEGTPAIGSQTVTPGPISGKLPLTRELVDSSSPSADQLALAAMVEDYHRQVEEKIYTTLNVAQADGAFSGHIESNVDGAAGLKQAISEFSLVRGKRPRWAIYDAAEDTFAAGLDGSTGDTLSAFREQGVRINPATNAMTTGATDAQAFVVGPDLWSFDFPVLEFRYAEKSGPELVEAAVFGYHADLLNQNSGLAVVVI